MRKFLHQLKRNSFLRRAAAIRLYLYSLKCHFDFMPVLFTSHKRTIVNKLINDNYCRCSWSIYVLYNTFDILSAWKCSEIELALVKPLIHYEHQS